MFHHVTHPGLVPFDGSFSIDRTPTQPPDKPLDKAQYRELLDAKREELDRLQRLFYAHDRHALLLIFQGLDASGKDSTVRAVMRSIDPGGCYVHAFKQPSQEELQHDFLWRTGLRLPGRGMIGIFNRSYYEEVLITRVHPELLTAQRLPSARPDEQFWQERFESIRQHELHLARNGTLIMKFWLNISPGEQRRRFLKRLKRPDKHWKFSEDDIRERDYWDDYMQAYQAMLNATSRDYAPWYAIPADNKPTKTFTTKASFRATHRAQIKAQRAGNGQPPLSSAATQNCALWVTPCGRVSGRPSAALRRLDIEWLCRRHRALRPDRPETR